MSDARIRVLIADEHPLLRGAVRLALESEEDLEVLADVDDGVEAVAAAEKTRPHVAIIGAAPSDNGKPTVGAMRERVPDCRVLVLSEDDHQCALIDAIEAGASGFLTKKAAPSDLPDAVRALHRGQTVVPPEMLGDLVSELIRRRRDETHALVLIAELTRREREVLACLARGLDTASVADELVISPETARTHIQHVLCKLGVHSRLEAAALVNENNLLPHLTA